MSTITFEEGSKYTAKYGSWKEGNYTPIYMCKNGKRYFIKNIVEVIKYSDQFDKYNYEKSINELEGFKEKLKRNNGSHIMFYGKYDDPFEFIEWVKENNYTFEVFGGLFYEGDSYVDFHGNLCEYSAAFHYRIYDSGMITKLKELIHDCKKRFNYKNN